MADGKHSTDQKEHARSLRATNAMFNAEHAGMVSETTVSQDVGGVVYGDFLAMFIIFQHGLMWWSNEHIVFVYDSNGSALFIITSKLMIFSFQQGPMVFGTLGWHNETSRRPCGLKTVDVLSGIDYPKSWMF